MTENEDNVSAKPDSKILRTPFPKDLRSLLKSVSGGEGHVGLSWEDRAFFGYLISNFANRVPDLFVAYCAENSERQLTRENEVRKKDGLPLVQKHSRKRLKNVRTYTLLLDVLANTISKITTTEELGVMIRELPRNGALISDVDGIHPKIRVNFSIDKGSLVEAKKDKGGSDVA
jgi:hypothetical protein